MWHCARLSTFACLRPGAVVGYCIGLLPGRFGEEEKKMADQIVKDKSGTEMGTIKELEFGKLKAVDRLGTALGIYDPATDKTYDRLGLEIGNGNQLTWLIFQSPQI
jgi:hypothetical protein